MLWKKINKNKILLVYVIVLSILFFLFFSLYCERENLKKEGNIVYNGASLWFVAPKSELENVKKLSFTEKLVLGVENVTLLNYKNGNKIVPLKFDLLWDTSLNDNETIIHVGTSNEENINIEYDGINIELKVINTYDTTGDTRNIYVSEKIFEMFSGKTESYIYRLYLNDWFDYQKALKEIERKINNVTHDEAGNFHKAYIPPSNFDYMSMIPLYTYALYVFFFIYLIILFVSIVKFKNKKKTIIVIFVPIFVNLILFLIRNLIL